MFIVNVFHTSAVAPRKKAVSDGLGTQDAARKKKREAHEKDGGPMGQTCQTCHLFMIFMMVANTLTLIIISLQQQQYF